MLATVLELERARDELTELIPDATRASTVDLQSAADLTGRLDGLRKGLVEVRRASDPEAGRGRQGLP